MEKSISFESFVRFETVVIQSCSFLLRFNSTLTGKSKNANRLLSLLSIIVKSRGTRKEEYNTISHQKKSEGRGSIKPETYMSVIAVSGASYKSV